MGEKFYLDTAIWRDYFEDRKDGIRPLGEFAFQFLKDCQKNKRKVLFSDLVVEELKSDYSDERIAVLFSPFEDVLVKVFLSDEQISEARKISSSVKETHFKDALHAVLARDNKAIMITRDRHFGALADIVKIAMPEDIHF